MLGGSRQSALWLLATSRVIVAQQPVVQLCWLYTGGSPAEASRQVINGSVAGLLCLSSEEDVLCEAKYGGLFRGLQPRGEYFPEIGSVFSALFIIWCGIHMLIFWTHESIFFRFLAALFVVNGWSSFGYHYGKDPICGFIDKLSMLFTVWVVAGFILCVAPPARHHQPPFPARPESPACSLPHKHTTFSRRLRAAHASDPRF